MAISSCDPAALVAAARCFICIPKSFRHEAALYLLCNVTSKATPPCVTPDSPINSSGSKQITNTTIRVSWNQISNSGSLITSYTVKWGTASGVYTNSATVAVVPKIYTITGLNSGTQYFWAVQANSFAGCSSVNSNEGTGTTTGSAPGPCAAGTAFATAWAARVVVNGGAVPSAATQTAIANFQCGLITDGLDTLMISWNAIVPDGIIAFATPQLKGPGNDPWTNSGFVVGQLAVGGLSGDAANDLVTGIPGTSFPNDNNQGISIYMPGVINNNVFDSGYSNGALSIGCFLSRATTLGQTSVFGTGGTYPANWAQNATALAAGFYSGSRTAANSVNLYWGNSGNAIALKATSVLAGAARTADVMNVYSINLVGTSAHFAPTSNTISFVAFHQGLTLAQTTLLFNRVQTLRMAIGGGFV